MDEETYQPRFSSVEREPISLAGAMGFHPCCCYYCAQTTAKGLALRAPFRRSMHHANRRPGFRKARQLKQELRVA